MLEILLASVALILITIIGLHALLSAGAPPRQVGGGADPPKVTLGDLQPRHEKRLRAITAQRKTMRAVGDGRTWPAEKVKRFIDYNAEEQEQGDDRENFYWGIFDGGELAGVVGIHPVTYGKPATKGLSFVTIFIDARRTGRGLGTTALRDALETFWAVRDSPVYADVRATNAASLALLTKLGFEEVSRHKMRRAPYIRLRATKSAP